MLKILLHAFCASAYGVLALHFWRSRWQVWAPSAGAGGQARQWERGVLAALVALHAFLLFRDVLGGDAFRFGFAHAMSMMALLALVFYGFESIIYPLEGMPALGGMPGRRRRPRALREKPNSQWGVATAKEPFV